MEQVIHTNNHQVKINQKRRNMQKQQTTQSSNTIIAGQRSEITRRKSGKAYNFLSSLPFVRSFSNKPFKILFSKSI